jgi:hypothetical protein
MPLIAEYAKRFGIYDDLPPYLAMSLGSGETTLMRLTTAYSMLANGGKRIKNFDRPHPGPLGSYDLPARRANLRGATRRHGKIKKSEPIDKREQVLDPLTAVSNHLDHGRRHPARHRAKRSRKSASTSPAKPGRPTTPRIFGSSVIRQISRWAYSWVTISRVR